MHPSRGYILKIEDLTALKQMNPSKRLYLKVVGKGDRQHLTVCKRSFCGRVWMWLGFSSSSMKKIAAYILQNKEHFKQTTASNLSSLKEKLERFTAAHPLVKFAKRALKILSEAKPLPNEPPPSPRKPESISSKAEVIPPQPMPLSVKSEGVIKQSAKKINESLPREVINSVDPEQSQISETARLQSYLERHNGTENALVYFSTGWRGGEEVEGPTTRLCPGFIFEALCKGITVQTILLEHPKETVGLSSLAFTREYKDYINATKSEHHYDNMQVSSNFDTSYNLSRFRSGPYTPHMQPALESYFEKALNKGSQVVIEDYGYSLEANVNLIELYNKLRAKFPGQISYLWRGRRQNVITKGPIDVASYDEKKAAEWTYYPNLFNCHLEKPKKFLDNKERVVEEFNRKFITSASAYNKLFAQAPRPLTRYNKEIGTQQMGNEINKLLTFLAKEPAGTHSLLYICIGAQGWADQIWPGFIFKHLEQGKKVKTLNFETLLGNRAFGLEDHFNMMQKTYGAEEVSFLDTLNENYDVHQFLCGYPDDENAVENDTSYNCHFNMLWPKQEQITEAYRALEKYLRRELKAGVTVVLGEHRGYLGGWIANSFIFLYDDLLEEFPGQVKLLWGYNNNNCYTDKEVTENDLDFQNRTAIWTYHERLRDCFIN